MSRGGRKGWGRGRGRIEKRCEGKNEGRQGEKCFHNSFLYHLGGEWDVHALLLLRVQLTLTSCKRQGGLCVGG